MTHILLVALFFATPAHSGILDVTAADGVSCALRDGATPSVLCWGDLAGLRAEQALLDPAGPTDTGGPPNLVAIETDGWRLLGIDREGTLWKWQIGGTPVELHKQVAEVAMGSHSVCVRTHSGEARCWFEGWSGEEPLGEPTWIRKGTAEVAVGPNSWCARTTAGEMRCQRQPYADNSAPSGLVASDRGGRGMLVGPSGACLIRAGEPPACQGEETPTWADRPLTLASYGWTDDRWGWCATGEDGQTRCSFDSDGVAVDLAFDDPPDEMELGKDFACGRWADEVRCWGEGGVAGLVEDPVWRGPVQVLGLTDATAIEATPYRTCATRKDGWRLCWGPEAGGPPSPPSGDEPDAEEGCRLVQGVLVETGYEGSCQGFVGQRADLFAADGRTACMGNADAIRCSGDGAYGELGHGRLEERGEGNVVGLVPPIRQLVARDGAFCALDSAGVACWGLFALAPYRLGIPEPVDLSLGGAGLVCAATSGGELWCRSPHPMPYLLEDHLGVGRLPQQVAELDGVVEVTMGVDHGCVRHTDGRVSCFGRPSAWRLGDHGTFVREPTRVPLETTNESR